MGSIYKYTNTITCEVYIGLTTRDAEKTRKREHLSGSGSKYLKADIEKYGENVFVFEILHDGIIPEFLGDLEREEIAKHNCVHPNGYNRTHGNSVPCQETCKKLSKSRKGKKLSKSHRDNIGKALKGKKHSEARCRKNAESHKGQRSWNKGKRFSEESRKNMSEGSLTDDHKRVRHFYFFLDKNISSEDKRKRLRETFSDTICLRTLRRWAQKWEAETDKRVVPQKSPFHDDAYSLFFSLPPNMDITEKRKRLYQEFPNMHRATIWRWCKKFDTEK